MVYCGHAHSGSIGEAGAGSTPAASNSTRMDALPHEALNYSYIERGIGVE